MPPQPTTRGAGSVDGTQPAPVERPPWAAYLTQMRLDRALSGAEMARRMGVTHQTWAGIESGTRTRNGVRVATVPKENTLARAADALALTSAERRRLFTLAHQTRSTPTAPWQTRLKAARLAARVTPKQAAAAAGVHLATYREWERKSSGGARHDALRTLLAHLGMNRPQIEQFMADVPADIAAARAPQQRRQPVDDRPAWSRFLTDKRLSRGLYLSDVDARLGQQSVYRRFELGGWRRADGRLSVPSCAWLDRVAAALELAPDETSHLHLLADTYRLTVATAGTKPLVAELLHEARRAEDVSMAQAAARIPGLPVRWNALEAGGAAAHAATTPAVVEAIISGLPVRPFLAAALRTAVTPGAQLAENNDGQNQLDTAVPA